MNGDHHDTWMDSTAHVIEIMAPVAKYAGPGGWSVMRHLFVTKSESVSQQE